MFSRVVLIFNVAVALLGAAQLASAQPGYWYAYHGDWRQCWTTMSGLGVCVPLPYDRPQVPLRQRQNNNLPPNATPSRKPPQ